MKAMKPKRKEFREPETAKGFGFEDYEEGNRLCSETSVNNYGFCEVPVRIIRERDYQRLLRAAKGKGK